MMLKSTDSTARAQDAAWSGLKVPVTGGKTVLAHGLVVKKNICDLPEGHLRASRRGGGFKDRNCSEGDHGLRLVMIQAVFVGCGFELHPLHLIAGEAAQPC